MHTDKDFSELNLLTEKVIGAIHEVSNQLGAGFIEKVYENALAIELARLGMRVEKQRPIEVQYKGQIVGSYVADIAVEEAVLIEVKAVQALDPVHQAQCINYLKASGRKLCLFWSTSVDQEPKSSE